MSAVHISTDARAEVRVPSNARGTMMLFAAKVEPPVGGGRFTLGPYVTDLQPAVNRAGARGLTKEEKMRKAFLMGAASAIALLIAACGSNEEPAQNEMAGANDMNAAMADPNNPFAQAEVQMHQAMTAAVGADPSETWIRKMIEHHRGAVAMSDIVLAQNPTPDVRAMAEKTKTDQSREISKLEAMLRPDETSAATAPRTASPAQTNSPPAAGSPPRTAETNTTNTTKPAPKPAPKPEQPADPHANHVMNNMQ